MVNRASPDRCTVSPYSRCSGVSGVSRSRPVIPITPFIGVRISWLIVARNALLARVAASALHELCGDLRVQGVEPTDQAQIKSGRTRSPRRRLAPSPPPETGRHVTRKWLTPPAPADKLGTPGSDDAGVMP
jgi:hypothetical protein